MVWLHSFWSWLGRLWRKNSRKEIPSSPNPEKKSLRPPLGVMPERIWREQRVADLEDALLRQFKHYGPQTEDSPHHKKWEQWLDEIESHKVWIHGVELFPKMAGEEQERIKKKAQRLYEELFPPVDHAKFLEWSDKQPPTTSGSARSLPCCVCYEEAATSMSKGGYTVCDKCGIQMGWAVRKLPTVDDVCAEIEFRFHQSGKLTEAERMVKRYPFYEKEIREFAEILPELTRPPTEEEWEAAEQFTQEFMAKHREEIIASFKEAKKESSS